MPRITFGTRPYITDEGTEQIDEFLLFDGVEVEGSYYPHLHEDSGKISVTITEAVVRKHLYDLRVRDV